MHYNKKIKFNAIKTAPSICPKCNGDIIFDDNCLIITCVGVGFKKGCGAVFEYNYHLDDSVYHWEEFIEDDYIDDIDEGDK